MAPGLDQRPLGRTGRTASVVGLGTWQLGADWGDVSESAAREVLEASLAEGVTFFDTADVYGDGRSERIVGALPRRPRRRAACSWRRRWAAGRTQVPESYVAGELPRLDRPLAREPRRRHARRSSSCTARPSAVIASDAVFDALDALVESGAVAAYGVSVETVRAGAGRDRPARTVTSIQIILNAFRLKPLDQVLPAAAGAGVAIIARVPLASGLLSGRYDAHTTFAPDDHRSYNRDGSAFDVGETFSGVDFETGVVAAAGVQRARAPSTLPGATPAQAAIAWVAQQPGVTTVIPGARNAEPGPVATPGRVRSVRCPPRCSTACGRSTTGTSGRPCTGAGSYQPRSRCAVTSSRKSS